MPASRPVRRRRRTAGLAVARRRQTNGEDALIRRRRRIKIIATLGPASADRSMVAALFEAGADVFRINMSHASHDAMRERVAMICSLEEEYGRPIGVLVDLQGPKLRVGEFESGAVLLRKGDAFTLDSDKAPGGQTRVFLPHPEILDSLAARRSRAHRRRQGAAARRRRRARPRGHDRRGRRAHFQQEGRQPARHDHSDFGDDREGSRRSRRRAGRRRRLDRAVLRAAPRGRDRGQENRRRTAPWSWRKSKSRRRSRTSTKSSPSPTRSWSRAATSAWKCRSKKFRACKRPSRAWRAASASRWSSPRKCWN